MNVKTSNLSNYKVNDKDESIKFSYLGGGLPSRYSVKEKKLSIVTSVKNI